MSTEKGEKPERTQMVFKIGDRVKMPKYQNLVGTVVEAGQDAYGDVYRVAFDIGGSGFGGECYGRHLELLAEESAGVAAKEGGAE